MVELLLDNKSIDVNKKYDFNYKNGNIVEKYPLSVALEKNYKEIALLLLNHPKIDVNIKILHKKIDFFEIIDFLKNFVFWYLLLAIKQCVLVDKS